ncbi:MAG: tyrosine decarboxylase MfnA [Archaeoglobaceae archaeon]|nr:tyrosine decarboxylase MfnA [Archaeoglobaceae archaeon]MCX8151950.1 tyrosine decarboxylase MfnA [Archaeoglobaceae archaeon]MDW8013339.1 tyrosine decarboxylase MfnA [Archaeoglobaceae archaeon]
MDVIDELKSFRERDVPYTRVLSSMCTIPHPIAVEAHKMFINVNLGDPGIFRGSFELEKKLIEMLGRILHNQKASGYICSGGTEANIQAIRSFRNKNKSKKVNIVVPKTAHFSFDKAGEILCIEVKKAGVDENYRVDLGEVESLVDDRTIALVGVAGTTELGQIDPIVELSKLAEEKGIDLHVDAAFGGLVIPFLDNPYPFDFVNRGVSSLTVDPHKMGMATIPAGGILFRDESYLKFLEIETPYLTSKTQFTLTGTRPATGVASAYAVLKQLGFDGMRKIVKECMKNTKIVLEEVQALGFEQVIEPVMNIVAFKSDKAEKIRDKFYEKGWVISTIREPKAIRLVVMPHVTEEVIKEFISTFKKILSDL